MPSVFPRLALVCLGHPLDPRTWSGTPANIGAELQRRGALAAAIDSESYLPRPWVLGVKLLSKAYYGGSRYVRLGRVERPLRARHVAGVLRTAGVTAALHFNVHALPAMENTAGVQHFLFTDTTWHLWQQFSTDAGRVHPRLVRDAERLEQIAYRQTAHIFSISEYVKEDLVRHYGVPAKRVTVVGTGRGAIQPYYGEKDYRAETLLFVAKERFRDKGGEALLTGFQLARRERPGLKLWLVGRPEYRELAAGVPGASGFGRLPLVELQAMFEQASLFVMPARNEPWGLVYLEALSCRTPVVGLDRLSIPEITGNGQFGFRVKTGEPNEIAEVILEAFRDPERLAVMGREGQRKCLERFTWEKTVQGILDTLSFR